MRCWQRMGRDSNPRYGYPYCSFQDCRLRPLGHPSGPGKPAMLASQAGSVASDSDCLSRGTGIEAVRRLADGARSISRSSAPPSADCQVYQVVRSRQARHGIPGRAAAASRVREFSLVQDVAHPASTEARPVPVLAGGGRPSACSIRCVLAGWEAACGGIPSIAGLILGRGLSVRCRG